MKRTSFAVCLLIPLLAVYAFAQSPSPTTGMTSQSTVGDLMNPYVKTFDLKLLGAFVDKLKQMPSLPIIQWDQTLPPSVAQPIPDEAQATFAKIQLAAFGKETSFKLVSSDLSGPAQCLAQQQEIATSPDFMNYYLKQGAAGQKAMTFVLAHELSHYIHELYIQKFSGNGLSPSGLPSRRLFSASTQFDYSMEENPLSATGRFLILFGPQASSHAEVDAFAYIIMQRMGYSSSEILGAQELALDVSANLEVSSEFPTERTIGFSSSLGSALSLDSPEPLSHIPGNVAALEPLVRVKSLIQTAR